VKLLGRSLVGVVKQAQVTVRGGGLYDVEYTPDAEGPCKVDVTYAGQPVPNRCEIDEVSLMMMMMMMMMK